MKHQEKALLSEIHLEMKKIKNNRKKKLIKINKLGFKDAQKQGHHFSLTFKDNVF